jgi:hypothetical protein
MLEEPTCRDCILTLALKWDGGLDATGLTSNPLPWVSYVYTHSAIIHLVSFSRRSVTQSTAEAWLSYFRATKSRSLTVGVPERQPHLWWWVFPGIFRRERKDSRRCTPMKGNPRGWAKRRQSPMGSPVAAITGVSSGRHCSLVQTDAQSTSKTPRSAHYGV